VTTDEDTEGHILRIAHRGLVSDAGRFEVDVDVEIRLPSDDDAFRLVLCVRNVTSRRIPNLMFPLLGGCGAHTEGDQDLLVFPSRIVPMRELLPHDGEALRSERCRRRHRDRYRYGWHELRRQPGPTWHDSNNP